MRFHPDNSRPPTLAKYRPFIGRQYKPPFGCFHLVQEVFAEVYGINVEDHTIGLRPDMRSKLARFHERLALHCMRIVTPREGTVVIIGLGGEPWHIGVVIDDAGNMLHSYEGGSAVIESYNGVLWRNRIEGFYRYVG